MKVLGLSYDFHDASAALVVDGKLVASALEERFTRQKHDAGFPRFAIEHCLATAGIGASDLDQVVFYEDPAKKFGRVLASSLSGFPNSSGEFVESMKSWLGAKLWTIPRLGQRLGVDTSKIRALDHHQSHLAQAFLGSGFEESAILVVDAVGEWSTISLGHARWSPGLDIRTLEETRYPNSLGLFYSAFTAFLGFKPMNDECTTMALAALGQPRYLEQVRQVIQVSTEGQVTIDPAYLAFDDFMKAPFQPSFLALFGAPRSPDEKLSFSSFARVAVSDREQYYADLAASVQQVFEEAVLVLARRLRQLTGSPRLCFAGGAALNCVANARLLRDAGFNELFIPVDPGDGGASIGAAFLGSDPRSVPAERGIYTPYLGASFGDEIEEETVRHIQAGGGLAGASGWSIEKLGQEKDWIDRVAALLDEGQIVGWFQGRFELGPRALGNRSILFRPDRLELALEVSRNVKKRALYRPYALAMTDASASRILVGDGVTRSPYRWMQLAVGVRDEYTDSLRAGLHVDGTTRPQVCVEGENPLFYSLLQAFERRTGVPALINTSFNERGYPIVSSPLEALAMFARSDMQALVINRLIVRKNASEKGKPL